MNHSLLSGGCRVAGEVRSSVLSPRAEVATGAVVEDSVLLPGARVEAGAVVCRAVVDDGVVIGRGAHVASAEGDEEADIALLGRAVHFGCGAHVAAGGRRPEPRDDR